MTLPGIPGMQGGIVNGYQLLCYAHTILEPLELQLFFYFARYRPFHFSFYVFVTLDSPISFLGRVYSLCFQYIEDNILSCNLPI